MPVRDGEEGGLVGGVLAPGALLGLRVQLQLVEQDVAHLLGGGDVQVGFADHLPDVRLPLLELLPEPLGELVQLPQVHFHAGALHLREHLGQRLLHVVVEMLPVGELVEDLAAEEDEGGRLAGAGGRGLLGRLVEQ